MPTIYYGCDICHLKYLKEEDAEACERTCLNRRLEETYNYTYSRMEEEGDFLTTNGGCNESRE